MTKMRIKEARSLVAKIEKKKEEIAKGRDELMAMFSDLEDLTAAHLWYPIRIENGLASVQFHQYLRQDCK